MVLRFTRSRPAIRKPIGDCTSCGDSTTLSMGRYPSSAMRPSLRGSHCKFKLADGSDMDLVTRSFNGFPAAALPPLDSASPLSFTLPNDARRHGRRNPTEEPMDAMERRVFLKRAGMGMLAFTVGGADVLMTPGAARAQGLPFRLLKAHEAETIEALGETLVPGAQRSGVAHFIDQQVSVSPGEALLEARQLNVK